MKQSIELNYYNSFEDGFYICDGTTCEDCTLICNNPINSESRKF